MSDKNSQPKKILTVLRVPLDASERWLKNFSEALVSPVRDDGSNKIEFRHLPEKFDKSEVE